MRLDENNWIFSGGLTREWEWVRERRVKRAMADFGRILKVFLRQAPEPLRRGLSAQGLRYFLDHPSLLRDRLVCHPAFDYWLYLWGEHFSSPSNDSSWNLQFGLFQGFAAFLAAMRREPGKFDVILDSDAHLHFYGSPAHLEFPKRMALQSVRLTLSGGRFAMRGPEGLVARFPARLLTGPGPARRSFGPVSFRRAVEIIPTMSVETCGFLTTSGVVMHGLADPGPGKVRDFAGAIRTALSHVRERDPRLYAEMTDMVCVLTPLVNPVEHGSVSSSYVNMRGAICLSHSGDPLLQAETLIHEFCHQKMNQLLLAEPILLPGQSGQVFYSPWRPDARRLRGLILGAHAFLNVARYLIRSLERENYPLRSKIAVMCNVARRLFEVEQGVRSACAYGLYTEFGRRFMLGMWGELAGLFHAVQWFPPALIKEARLVAERHRRLHALPLTGIHKGKGFSAGVRHVPFGQRRIIRRRGPPDADRPALAAGTAAGDGATAAAPAAVPAVMDALKP